MIGSKRAADLISTALAADQIPSATNPQIVRVAIEVDDNIDRDRINISVVATEYQEEYPRQATVRRQIVSIEVSTAQDIDIANAMADEVIAVLLDDPIYDWSITARSETPEQEPVSRRATIYLTTEIQS